jgi:predicted transcriptional regulator
MESTSADALFFALSHESRRRMLDLMMEHPGMTVRALASHFSCSRVMVLKHLSALEAADLVISQKHGRERRLYFNVVPIQQMYDRWTNTYTAFWASKMVDLKSRLEERAQAREHRRA